MEQKTTAQASPSSPMWECLEAFVREQVQRFIQALLVEEITELLGRPKSARRGGVDAPPGMRNGYGKPRRSTLTSGTIMVRRPRVRGLEERFVSRVLLRFQRRTRQVSELLPQLYLHGLALDDFELALRGLLGEKAPLSAARFKKVNSATAIIWKLLQVAEQSFRRLNAPELLPAAYAGATRVDGIKQHASQDQDVAA